MKKETLLELADKWIELANPLEITADDNKEAMASAEGERKCLESCAADLRTLTKILG